MKARLFTTTVTGFPFQSRCCRAQRVSERGRLALESGAIYEGSLFGAAAGVTESEVVFNTCMTGYQEIATDPSYAGQMVVMTYPLIGNYGCSPGTMESSRAHCAALIVRELSP